MRFVGVITKKQFTHIVNGGVQTCQLYCVPLRTPHLRVTIYTLFLTLMRYVKHVLYEPDTITLVHVK